MHGINCHLLLEKLLDSGLSSCAAQRFEFLLTLTVASETKTWSPKKQVKLVLKLDSVYALIGFLTLYKRWETKSWPFKGLLSPKQSFPWSWSVIQRHGLTKKKKKTEKNCFRHWTVFMRWSGFWLCTRDGRLNAEPLRGQCHPKNIFLSLDLWCKDLFQQKQKQNGFSHWTVFICYSGFWLCTRDGRLKACPLGDCCHPKNLFLIHDLWCKDLVWRKKRKNCFGHWTVFMRWSGVWLCTRDGRLIAYPIRDCCHPKILFLSLDLWCKDLVLKKRIILFQPLNCLYELIGCLTLYKRWETKCWSFKGSVSPK